MRVKRFSLYLVRLGILGVLVGLILIPFKETTPGSALAAETIASPASTQIPTSLNTPSPTPSPTVVPLNTKTSINSVSRTTSISSRQDFGIAGNMASLSLQEMNSRLDGIKSLGVGWVRFDIEWSNIELTQGQYNWTSYDQEVRAITNHGLKSLAIIDYTPAWARRSDCSDSKMCAPANPDTYANFAGVAAARYRPYGVSDWEIWNEPNNINFYKPTANSSEYVSILKAAYIKIKQVNPGAAVITGGTAPESSGGGYLSPPDFLNGIYAAGGKGYFDAVAAHPYTWPYSPAWVNPNGAWGQMTAMHNTMSNNGDGSKKIWITEYGAPTGGPGSIANSGFSTVEGGADHVTELLQSRIISDSIALETKTSWIGPFFLYSYQDAGTNNDTVENFFGLLRSDGSQKPAYAVFKNAVGSY